MAQFKILCVLLEMTCHANYGGNRLGGGEQYIYDWIRSTW